VGGRSTAPIIVIAAAAYDFKNALATEEKCDDCDDDQPVIWGFENGAPGGTRTPDLVLRRHTL
jgi:hypothetical protein